MPWKFPPLITSPESVVTAALGIAAKVQAAGSPDRARLLGAHLEGPFLSQNRLGTHEASARRDPDLARRGRRRERDAEGEREQRDRLRERVDHAEDPVAQLADEPFAVFHRVCPP